MARTVDPETEARIAELAKRLGLAGPDAPEQVLQMALDALDAKIHPQSQEMTSVVISTELGELEKLSTVGRRWREENPEQYDEIDQPSIAWQKELYDENGLPK